MSLLQELRSWRKRQAVIEGLPEYRILPNATLEALVGACPQNREEMLAIKGIKEAKFSKYGGVLLKILNNGEASPVPQKQPLFEIESVEVKEEVSLPENDTLSVSQFLDSLNVELSGMAARIRGEVTSVDERERVVYFSLKDSEDESALNCLIFRHQYEISGVKLAIGDEVIVEGVPDIYKPNGRLSLKVGMIELFGEGALKKAYDALKQKLETEGVFALEKKRALPEFPKNIALITSEQGAAIGDFTMNLGSQGLKVDFYPTSVEGKKAVFEIIEALRYFRKHADQYDVLVVVRGGGSLESLQAFNNETLIREVAASPIPTLFGVGHEKDVTLAALAADVMVSTPTATARTLREPFEKARTTLSYIERGLVGGYDELLRATDGRLVEFSHHLMKHSRLFSEHFATLRERFMQSVPVLEYRMREIEAFLMRTTSEFLKQCTQWQEQTSQSLSKMEEALKRYDPKRALALGYSLIQKEGKILRSASEVEKGDILALRLAKGRLAAEVTEVYTE